MNYQELFSGVPEIETRYDVSPYGHYQLTFLNKRERFLQTLRWLHGKISDQFLIDQSEKIKTIVYHRTIFEYTIYQSEEDLRSFIERNFPSYTPGEKLEMVLEDLFKRTSYDGEQFTF
jgi:hypothetical protein